MAALSRVNALGWGDGDLLTPTQINALDTNLAGAVSRAGTASGTRFISMRPLETICDSTRICTPSYDKITCVNTGAGQLLLPIDGLPHGHLLTAVAIKLLPAGSHSSSAPLHLPHLHVYRVNSSGSATELGDEVYDWTAGDPSNYEAGFTLTAAFSHTLDCKTYTYMAALVLENGTNSVTGLQVLSLSATCTIDHANAGADISIWV
jgi:hypothetical protein